MKRFMMVVGIIALVPLLMGAGGGAPGIPSDLKIAGPTFQASIVLDPHEPGITTRAKQATIRIYRSNDTAAAMFDIPAIGFPLFRGCDLSKTNGRFLQNRLSSWIPAPALQALFSDVGIGISDTDPVMDPIITRIVNDNCTSDPDNLGPIPDGGDGSPSQPGILSFQATIRFVCPRSGCPQH